MRRSINSEQTDRGGGGRESFELKKLDESPPSEKFHKRLPLANPRLANALKWCHKRKLEREVAIQSHNKETYNAHSIIETLPILWIN
jgi:hypothetical protein